MIGLQRMKLLLIDITQISIVYIPYVYEYVGTQALHTKTVLAGDTLSIVGSCNLDMRSVYLDTEMMLFIECKELNETLREHTEKLKLKSRQVAPDGTIIDECESLLKLGGVKYENVEKNKARYVDKCNHDGIDWCIIHNKTT